MTGFESVGGGKVSTQRHRSHSGRVGRGQSLALGGSEMVKVEGAGYGTKQSVIKSRMSRKKTKGTDKKLRV